MGIDLLYYEPNGNLFIVIRYWLLYILFGGGRMQISISTRKEKVESIISGQTEHEEQ